MSRIYADVSIFSKNLHNPIFNKSNSILKKKIMLKLVSPFRNLQLKDKILIIL